MRAILKVAVVACATVIARPASAQYNTGFEAPDYPASNSGIVTPPTDGWYTPVAGSNDFRTYKHFTSNLFVSANPFGNSQFIAGAPTAVASPPGFARIERLHSFASGGTWTICFDILVIFNGTLPAQDNIGSFSLQPATARQFVALARWQNPAVASSWKLGYNWWNAAGAAQATTEPGAAWSDLAVNKWYRIGTTFDLNTNIINQVSIQDLTTLVITTANPPGWFLQGGQLGGALAMPDALRLFVGGGTGGVPGNNVAIDNFNVSLGAVSCSPAPCYPNCNGDSTPGGAPILNLADFGCFQTKFALQQPYADCNADGLFNLADFGCFQTKFALGCF